MATVMWTVWTSIVSDGPDNDEEPAEYRAVCSEGEDNDGDGWIDEADPSCELTNET